jgi:hypothetical protein
MEGVGSYVHLVTTSAYTYQSCTINAQPLFLRHACTKLQGVSFKDSHVSRYIPKHYEFYKKSQNLNTTCNEITWRFECLESVATGYIHTNIHIKLKLKTRKRLTLSGISSTSVATPKNGHPCNKTYVVSALICGENSNMCGTCLKRTQKGRRNMDTCDSRSHCAFWSGQILLLYDKYFRAQRGTYFQTQ